MKKKVSVFVFVGIALLFVFAAIGSQHQVSAEGGPPTVPFKAAYTTFPVVTGVVDGHLVLEIWAVGKGTHLGKSEWYADSLADMVDPTYPTQTGEMYFTAANGDKLIGHFEGGGQPNDSGGNDYWGDYWITEGTGRFTGATGSGTYYGSAGEVEGTAVFAGTLTMP